MEETTTINVTPGKHAVTYGVVLGIILVLISLVMYVTGMALEGVQWPMYLYYIIFPVTLIIAIKSFKKENAGYLSLSQALKVGVATAVISAIIFLLYNLLFNYVIEPTWSEQIIDATRDKMNEMGNLTEDQVEMSLQYVKWGSDPLIGGAIWLAMSAFFGLLYSLFVGLVMKNNKPYEA